MLLVLILVIDVLVAVARYNNRSSSRRRFNISSSFNFNNYSFKRCKQPFKFGNTLGNREHHYAYVLEVLEEALARCQHLHVAVVVVVLILLYVWWPGKIG